MFLIIASPTAEAEAMNVCVRVSSSPFQVCQSKSILTMESQAIPMYLQPVHCRHCTKSMRRKNLKEHTERCHPGRSVQEANQAEIKRLIAEAEERKLQEKQRKATAKMEAALKERAAAQKRREQRKLAEIEHRRQQEERRQIQEKERKEKKKQEDSQIKANRKRQLTTTGISGDSMNTCNVSSEKSLQGTSKQAQHQDTDKAKTPWTSVFASRSGGHTHTNSSLLIGGAATTKAMPSTSKVQQKTQWRLITRRGTFLIGNNGEQLTSANSEQIKGSSSSFVTHGTSAEAATNSVASRSMAQYNNAEESRTAVGLSASQACTLDDPNRLAISPDVALKDHNYSRPVTNSMPTSLVPQKEMKERFKNCKTLDEVLQASEVFAYNEEEKSFKCTTCQDSSSAKLISYSTSEDDSQTVKSQQLRDLKKKLLAHLYGTSVHERNVCAINAAELSKNQAAGRKVLRTIYGKLKRDGSYKSFEEDIAEREADDHDYGNINHGRTFASSMTKPFYQAVKQRVVKSLRRPLPGTGMPPPYCLVADKSTPCRNTLHTIGLIMPKRETGVLQSAVLGVKSCQDSSGLGTAEEMVDTLKEFTTSENIRASLVGVAVDGAYHHANIHDHMRDILQMSESERQLFSTRWDGAHLLELGAQKSRGQSSKDKVISVKWIRDTLDVITTVKSNYGRGKKWTQLQDEAFLDKLARQSVEDDQSASQTRDADLKKFQSFSNTRFSTYSHQVLSSFSDNYRATCLAMEKQGDPLLSKLKSPVFVLRTAGLSDFYKEVGDASLKLQSPRLYSWNVEETLEDTIVKLRQMSRNLEEGESDTCMPSFNAAVEEMQSTMTYKGVTLSDGIESEGETAHLPTILTAVRKDIAKKARDFCDDLERRMQQVTPPVSHLAKEAFSLRKVESRASDFVPPEFEKLVTLHRDSGFVNTDLSLEDWKNEYKEFCRSVVEEKNTISRNGFTPFQEKKKMGMEEAIYSGFFSSATKTENFRNVANLLCRAAVQSGCEAVTEGMGSIIQNKLRRRESLSAERLSQEVFVKLNGPKSNRRCNKVLKTAGDIRFGGRRHWRFIKYGTRSEEEFVVSKVVQKIDEEEEKFEDSSDSE